MFALERWHPELGEQVGCGGELVLGYVHDSGPVGVPAGLGGPGAEERDESPFSVELKHACRVADLPALLPVVDAGALPRGPVKAEASTRILAGAEHRPLGEHLLERHAFERWVVAGVEQDRDEPRDVGCRPGEAAPAT